MPVTCLLYTLMSGVLNICMCRSRLLQGVQLFATPWTVARQAPLSMGFLKQVYWSGFPVPAPGDLPDPGIEPASPVSPALQADPFPLSHRESLCMCVCLCVCINLLLDMWSANISWLELLGFCIRKIVSFANKDHILPL